MKQIKLLSLVAFTIFNLNLLVAQNVTKKITFNATVHDFGKIPQNQPATYDFEFTNNDVTPVVILEAKASCGCTTPQYSKEPIGPKQKSKLVIGYDAATLGRFYKTIFVSIEGETEIREFIIKGEVVKK